VKEKKKLCRCGMRITPWQQKFHERSVWHRNFELVRACLLAKMNAAQIARALGTSSAYVSMRLKEMSRG